MCLVDMEQTLAVQIEQDIHKFYLMLKNHNSHSVEFKKFCNDWAKQLLVTSAKWKILFNIPYYNQFSFWLNIFKYAYHREICSLHVPILHEHTEQLYQKIIEQMLTTLAGFFRSSGFWEKLTAFHVKQNKSFDQIEKRYAKLSKENINPHHEIFNLSIQPVFRNDFDIIKLGKSFMEFEKLLRRHKTITSSVAAYFYHIYLDRRHNTYGIHFYLTFNQHLRIDDYDYLNLISELWIDKTFHMGMATEGSLILRQQCPTLFDSTSQMLDESADCQSPLDYLGFLRDYYHHTNLDSNRICTRSKGFTDFQLIVL